MKNVFENDENYNCILTTSEGEEYKIHADHLANQKLNLWSGWYCKAGVHRIYIDKEKNVWGGDCRNDLLGDLFTDWAILEDHTICKKSTCTACTDDLIIEKFSPVHFF